MIYSGTSYFNGWWLGVPPLQETSICFKFAEIVGTIFFVEIFRCSFWQPTYMSNCITNVPKPKKRLGSSLKSSPWKDLRGIEGVPLLPHGYYESLVPKIMAQQIQALDSLDQNQATIAFNPCNPSISEVSWNGATPSHPFTDWFSVK